MESIDVRALDEICRNRARWTCSLVYPPGCLQPFRGYVSTKSVVKAERTKENKITTKMDGHEAQPLSLMRKQPAIISNGHFLDLIMLVFRDAETVI